MRCVLSTLLMMCAAPLNAAAADDWVETKVFPKKPGVSVRREDKQKTIGNWTITAGLVYKEDGDWIEIRHNQADGGIPLLWDDGNRDVAKESQLEAV